MRIAIVCNGRSGSSSTFNYLNCCLIKEHKKYYAFSETFNYVNYDREDNSMNRSENSEKTFENKEYGAREDNKEEHKKSYEKKTGSFLGRFKEREKS